MQKDALEQVQLTKSEQPIKVDKFSMPDLYEDEQGQADQKKRLDAINKRYEDPAPVVNEQ